MAFPFSNPYKAAWQAVAALTVAAVLYFGYVAGTRAYASYNFLNEVVGTIPGPDGKPTPLTRAAFINLQIAEASKPPTPAPAPPSAPPAQ
jgi:hypothetical protein